MIGAQIFIELGQTPEQIDSWFEILKNHGMKICRIRMFETYMHKSDDSWDFALFDLAFQAADKHDIKILLTLFPATSFNDVGGFKFPRNSEHLVSISEYIKNTVLHFKQFKSCYGWVLINEPGVGTLPNEEFTQDKLSEWKKSNPDPEHDSHGYNVANFEEERFLVEYNIWYLRWLAEEIEKYDPGSHLHVNNHAIFENIAEYDFPKWREILTSLGGSAHASWHFGHFERSQYAVAMSANCEIVRSGAGELPWQMTEIQGGNNTYSGLNPICPTKEEICQWLWIVITSGGTGAIFWTLNPRASGFEAGEWGMIDFLNKPTDRLLAAASVAERLSEEHSLFSEASPVLSGINILYTRESLWVEKKMQVGGKSFEGRSVGAVIKSSLGYFEALSEMGIQANLAEIGEFDFSQNRYNGVVIVLAHQISIPSKYLKSLEHFVSRGGKLIVDGLTGYYDENAHCIMSSSFPFSDLFGGDLIEAKVVTDSLRMRLSDSDIDLQGYMWKGTIQNNTSEPIVEATGDIYATRNQFGNGEVVWLPTLVGLWARMTNYDQLTSFLYYELKDCISGFPIRFKRHNKNMLLKTLKSGNTLITVTINKNHNRQEIELELNEKLKSTILFSDKSGEIVNGDVVSIASEETMVIKWHK